MRVADVNNDDASCEGASDEDVSDVMKIPNEGESGEDLSDEDVKDEDMSDGDVSGLHVREKK